MNHRIAGPVLQAMQSAQESSRPITCFSSVIAGSGFLVRQPTFMHSGAADPSSLSSAVTKALGSARHFPAIVFQGKADKSVNFVNGDQVVAQLSALYQPKPLVQLSEKTGEAGGYHYLTRMEQPPFWIASGRGFSEDKEPTDVGHEFAAVWQGVLDVVQTHNGVKLPIDVNISAVPSPSDFVASTD